MKKSVYKDFIAGLPNNEPSWPVTIILKDGTRLETLASEINCPDEEDFSIFIENEPHRGTASFGLEDIICILS